MPDLESPPTELWRGGSRACRELDPSALNRLDPASPAPAELEEELEEFMDQSATPWKFLSTEFLAFVAIFSVSTVALFVGRTDFQWWFGASMTAALNLGIVRTAKRLKILGCELRREEMRWGPDEGPE